MVVQRDFLSDQCSTQIQCAAASEFALGFVKLVVFIDC